MSEKIHINVCRYSPEGGGRPETQRFTVPYYADQSVLDALNYIKAELDGSVSFRSSCRMAVCGSCGMVLNGTPRLACSTYLQEFYPGEITAAPLDNFPVIRDLVVDISDFLVKLQSVKPWIIRQNPEDEKNLSEEYRQTPKQMAAYSQQSHCINCTLCYSDCAVYGLHPEFLGPAVIALGYRYNQDSRDQGKKERLRRLADVKAGVWRCPVLGECTKVCPKNVDPSKVIQRTKVESAINWFTSFLQRD
jgi:fumarate reductase iron-sulfur subunit